MILWVQPDSTRIIERSAEIKHPKRVQNPWFVPETMSISLTFAYVRVTPHPPGFQHLPFKADSLLIALCQVSYCLNFDPLLHGGFKFGHPSKYWPCRAGLNFIECAKHVPCGVVTLCWKGFLKLLRCKKASKREKIWLSKKRTKIREIWEWVLLLALAIGHAVLSSVVLTTKHYHFSCQSIV